MCFTCSALNTLKFWLHKSVIFVAVLWMLADRLFHSYDYSPQVFQALWQCCGGVLALRMMPQMAHRRLYRPCCASINTHMLWKDGCSVFWECVWVRKEHYVWMCPWRGALCILLVLVSWGMGALCFVSVLRCRGVIVLLLPCMWYEVMSEEHSVSVCPPRVADLCFESVNVLVRNDCFAH